MLRARGSGVSGISTVCLLRLPQAETGPGRGRPLQAPRWPEGETEARTSQALRAELRGVQAESSQSSWPALLRCVPASGVQTGTLLPPGQAHVQSGPRALPFGRARTGPSDLLLTSPGFSAPGGSPCRPLVPELAGTPNAPEGPHFTKKSTGFIERITREPVLEVMMANLTYKQRHSNSNNEVLLVKISMVKEEEHYCWWSW